MIARTGLANFCCLVFNNVEMMSKEAGRLMKKLMRLVSPFKIGHHEKISLRTAKGERPQDGGVSSNMCNKERKGTGTNDFFEVGEIGGIISQN